MSEGVEGEVVEGTSEEIDSETKTSDSGEMSSESNLTTEVSETSPINNSIEIYDSAQNRLDLTSESSEILAGRSAIFNMYLNITDPIQMKDTKITINLPVGYELGNTIEELTIAGVVPEYKGDTLVYQFSNLTEGISLNKKIYIRTENGVTLDNTKLSITGSYQSGETEIKTESTEVTLKSSASFSVTNKFTKTVGDEQGLSVPSPNDDAVWEFHANLPISSEGSQFIKEGTKIKYSILIDEGLTYQSMVNPDVSEPVITDEPRIVSVPGQADKEVNGKRLTWEIDAPTYEQQLQEVNSLGGQDLSMILHVEDNVKVFSNLQVNGKAEATFIGGDFKTSEKIATIMVGPNDEFGPENSMGTAYTPAHYGAADGKGTVSTGSQNADPDVYAGDNLTWRIKYSGGLDIQQTVADKFRFKRYEFEYVVDPKLDFTGITMQPNYFMPNSGVPAWTPIQEEPKFDVYVKYNDDEEYQTEPIVTNIETNKKHSASELGIDSSRQVTAIKLHASDAPVGLYGSALIHTKARSNEVGKIINHASQRIQGFVFNQGAIKDYTYSEDGIWDNDKQIWNVNSNSWKPFMAAKTANLIERPTGKEKVISTAISLKNTGENKTISSGDNEVVIKATSDKASISSIDGPLISYVALPKGILLDESKVNNLTADMAIVDNDFQNLGKQLIQINWDADSIQPTESLSANIPVVVDTGEATKSLGFEHYITVSDSNSVNVPDVSAQEMTVKEKDTLDINNNGDTEEFIFRSSNLYYAVKNEAVVISTEVVNNEYMRATNGLITANAGEQVKVNLNLHKMSSEVFDTMTLVGTIPTIQDSTITTAEERDSEIDTYLVNGLELPSEWLGKVSVYYSETATPNVVGELDRLTDYKQFEPILNPLNGEDANWVLEKEVKDFSVMKSFKIVSNDLAGQWVAGSDKTVGVNLATEIREASGTTEIEENAYMTAAVAVNELVPTEPTEPTEPIDPKEPQVSTNPKAPSSNNQQDSDKKLPQTSESLQTNLVIAGLSLIIVILGYMSYRRWKNNK